MFFEVTHVRVLRVLLLLVCMMDQQIEAVCARIPFHHSQKLLFMEEQKLLHGRSKQIEKPPAFLAKVSGFR